MGLRESALFNPQGLQPVDCFSSESLTFRNFASGAPVKCALLACEVIYRARGMAVQTQVVLVCSVETKVCFFAVLLHVCFSD